MTSVFEWITCGIQNGNSNCEVNKLGLNYLSWFVWNLKHLYSESLGYFTTLNNTIFLKQIINYIFVTYHSYN